MNMAGLMISKTFLSPFLVEPRLHVHLLLKNSQETLLAEVMKVFRNSEAQLKFHASYKKKDVYGSTFLKGVDNFVEAVFASAHQI